MNSQFLRIAQKLLIPLKKRIATATFLKMIKLQELNIVVILEAGSLKMCSPLNQEAYDAIGKAKKESKSESSDGLKGKIECQSLNLLFLFL